MFLTDDELEELTGYKRNADRCKWLDSHGWSYVTSITGRPAVLRSHAESMLSGSVKPRRPKLNLAAIRG